MRRARIEVNACSLFISLLAVGRHWAVHRGQTAAGVYKSPGMGKETFCESVRMCVFLRICVCASISPCKCGCVSGCVCVCANVWLCVCACARVWGCACVGVSVSANVRMRVCIRYTSVRKCGCVLVYVWVCLCVCEIEGERVRCSALDIRGGGPVLLACGGQYDHLTPCGCVSLSPHLEVTQAGIRLQKMLWLYLFWKTAAVEALFCAASFCFRD